MEEENVSFALKSDDTMMIRSLVSSLIAREKEVIKENIEKISNHNEEEIEKLKKDLEFVTDMIITEKNRISEASGGEIIDKETGERRVVEGRLKEEKEKVKALEKIFNDAIRQANITEKKYHAYILAKEEYDLISTAANPDVRRMKELKDKMDSYYDTYNAHITWQANSEKAYDDLQAEKNKLSEVEDLVDSFKRVGEEYLEFDRNSSNKTNDNLGHYMSTHWGAKKKRLENLISLSTGLVLTNNSPEKVAEFQNAFNSNVENIIFNSFLNSLQDVTKDSYFAGVEFSEDNKDEFLGNVFREMPNDLPDHFHPFFAILKNGSAVKTISDGEGTIVKILDLNNISPSDITTNFCQFVRKHFETACRDALKKFKERRENIVEDFAPSNNDDESDGYSRAEKEMEIDYEPSYGGGNYNNPNRLDPATKDFWSELKTYMLGNVNEMAKDAAISMRDYLPKKAYLMMLPEQKAIQEVESVFKKLINACDQELRNGRPISKKLKDILLLALGGAGNFEELEIEFNAIYAAFELYMYKFMIIQEENSKAENDQNGVILKKNQSDYIERLQEKRDEAQMKLNNPALADYDFTAHLNIQNSRLNDKIDFLLDNKRTTDGYGSGKDNSFIIDPHPTRM